MYQLEVGQSFLALENKPQWGRIQTEERHSSSAELGADVEAVPDHQQDGQQQDADVGEVVGADLHRDRLASNGAPAGGQSCPDKQSLVDRPGGPSCKFHLFNNQNWYQSPS